MWYLGCRFQEHMHLKIVYVGLDYGTIGRVTKRRIHSEGSPFIVVTSRVQALLLSMLPTTLHFFGTHPQLKNAHVSPLSPT